MRISKFFSKNVAISDIFSTFAFGFFLLQGLNQNTLWVKSCIRYYFAFSQEPRKLYLE